MAEHTTVEEQVIDFVQRAQRAFSKHSASLPQSDVEPSISCRRRLEPKRPTQARA